MQVLQYQGISLVSRGIRFKTRSKYSHSAILLDDDSVLESWFRGGVGHNESISSVHTPGTKVDVFSIIGGIDEDLALRFALSQVGKGYDLGTIFNFISRRDDEADDEMVCSEYVSAISAAGGRRLLSPRIPHSHIAPAHLDMSPFLSYSHTLVTT